MGRCLVNRNSGGVNTKSPWRVGSLVGPQQHRRRDRKPERLGRFQVDDKLEFGGLFDGEHDAAHRRRTAGGARALALHETLDYSGYPDCQPEYRGVRAPRNPGDEDWRRGFQPASIKSSACRRAGQAVPRTAGRQSVRACAGGAIRPLLPAPRGLSRLLGFGWRCVDVPLRDQCPREVAEEK